MSRSPTLDAAAHLASAPGVLGPAVLVCPDAPAIAERALDLLVDGLRMAIRDRGRGHVALTGGSSASALYGRLREDPRAGRVDWSRVHVWLGDERFVPFDDADSNWGTALREWLDRPSGAAVPASNRHPIPVDEALAADRDNHWAAARYAAEMAAGLPLREGLPSFDVWLLGLGTDGHILSAFPHGPALAVGQPLALGVAAPTHLEPHVARVTLAPHLLAAARSIVVMVPGVSKAAIVGECFGPRREPARLPAQLALRPNATWLLDAACAPAFQRRP